MDRESGAGFTKVICIIEGLEDYAGYYLKVQAKNENYIAQNVNAKGEEIEMLACTPDLISVVDSNTGTNSSNVLHHYMTRTLFNHSVTRAMNPLLILITLLDLIICVY